MLTRTLALCGRWSARDFLRGRSKRGGAIHTRHTHGSKGRYKRLSTAHGLRDGRRHAENHMQGGLGVKLGGGLFGLRIPRQHMLSTMSKEEFDVEVYGHPNITNPYRDHLDEHPSLRRVMQNATLDTNIVLLLPRAPRTPPLSSSSSRPSGDKKDSHDERPSSWIPPAWVAVVDSLSEALTALNQGPATSSDLEDRESTRPLSHVHVYLSTLESSEHCPDLGLAVTDVNGASTMRAALLSASTTLYERLSKGRVLERPGHAQTRRTTSLSTGHAHGTFLGGALKASPLTTAAWTTARVPESYTLNDGGRVASSSLSSSSSSASSSAPVRTRAQVKLDALRSAREADTRVPASAEAHAAPTFASDASVEAAAVVPEGGAQRLLRELRRRSPTALCVCARLPSTEAPHPPVRTTPSTPETATSEDHGKGETSVVQRAAPSKQRGVPLLKAEVDPDTTSGVWQTTATSLASLLHWHYMSHDPRAHNGDALPHSQRRLPLVVFLDASKLSLRKTGGGDRRVLQSAPARSLVSESFSKELASTGFHALTNTSCDDLVREIELWACDSQWRAFVTQESAVTARPTSSTLAEPSQETAAHHATA